MQPPTQCRKSVGLGLHTSRDKELTTCKSSHFASGTL